MSNYLDQPCHCYSFSLIRRDCVGKDFARNKDEAMMSQVVPDSKKERRKTHSRMLSNLATMPMSQMKLSFFFKQDRSADPMYNNPLEFVGPV